MADNRFLLHVGDCRDVMRDYPADHFDSIVSDPPYGLSFMGNGWDRGVPSEEFWREALRVAKPGAHLLAFGGTRTFHRLTCAIEDAGWEIRDCVMWVYGSGFPKSLDVSKAIDKSAGAEREVVGKYQPPNGQEWNLKQADGNNQDHAAGMFTASGTRTLDITAPATAEAKQWEGWGTALKPAWEPIIMARKPLIGTVAANVLEHGTGALNIDACRVGYEAVPINVLEKWSGFGQEKRPDYKQEINTKGRFPANLIHDGSDEVVADFPANQPGMSGGGVGRRDASMFGVGGVSKAEHCRNDNGSAARFFYCAKASRTDRDEGNTHPTVKPTDLMRYLCRLVTPPNGLVLDPFMGSGSTGKGALLEGFRFVGIDLDPAHVAIAQARCEHALCKSGVEVANGEVVVKPAPKARSSLKVLRRKVSDKQIDLFAQPIAQKSQEVQ